MVLAPLLLLAKPPVEIRLSSPKRTFVSGEEIAFSATAKNQTKAPISLVTEQDSMNWGRKAPFINIQMRLSFGGWENVVMKGVGRCGNANPLKLSDFMTIAPGRSEEFLRGMPWSKYEVSRVLSTPGEYTLRLRYDSTPDLRAWIGGPLQPEAEETLMTSVRGLYDATPKGVFLSSEVRIKVLPAKS